MELNLYRKVRPFPLLLLAFFLEACGGSGDTANSPSTSTQVSLPNIKQLHSKHYFRDQDDSENEIAGTLVLSEAVGINHQVTKVQLFWADALGDKVGDAWLTAQTSNDNTINIPNNTIVVDGVSSFLMYPIDAEGEDVTPSLIKFHDFIGNAQVSGPGGIADSLVNLGDDHPNAGDEETRDGAWYYGGLGENDRAKIPAYRSALGGGTCVYDNGLVAVSDMANGIDSYWKANASDGKANIVNEVDYPPFSFLCDEENPINLSFEVPRIKDEHGAWSYSAINDSMSYGTIVYDAFVRYLGEPPLEDKIRIRAHFGAEISPTGYETAYWDGVYVNIHGIIDVSKMATLDIIAHEVGHGVLSRISHLKAYDNELSMDARTLHEAFGDMSGVMVKYDFTGELYWIHGAESGARVRYLDRINTEADAIANFSDYDSAGDNFYLRIGMITYPFYLLTNKWGVETAYGVMLYAAENCWRSDSTLPHAANCIKQAAADNHLSVEDVREAFNAVGITLDS